MVSEFCRPWYINPKEPICFQDVLRSVEFSSLCLVGIAIASDLVPKSFLAYEGRNTFSSQSYLGELGQLDTLPRKLNCFLFD